MHRRSGWVLAVLLATAVAGPGCVFILFVPDTHNDMQARLDALPLPSDFERIGQTQGGLRSGFAAAPHPYVRRQYIAPWRDRALCDQLEALTLSMGGELMPQPASANSDLMCTYVTDTRSGWRGWIVGVWSYRLRVAARHRELARGPRTDADCRDELRRLGSHSAPLEQLEPGCRIGPGSALVSVGLTGDQMR